MALEFGEGGGLHVTMDGPFGSTGSGGLTKMVSINAPVANWKGGESPFSQVVAVDGISVHSKIDIQLDDLKIFDNQIIAFQAVNESGIATLFAYGSKPSADCVFQATIIDVDREGVIYGDIVTNTSKQANYDQDDPGKADYIKNKPTTAIKKAQDTANAAKITAEAALARTGGEMTGPVTVLEPAEDNHPATKQYVDKVVSNTHMTADVTLHASGWSAEAPYTQTVAVEGMLATDQPHYGVVYSGDWEAEKEAFGFVDDLDTADGSVTFTCFEEKPEGNLTIQLEVNR